jgi:UDP-3-O-[3-hydroxymyristoyl] glucosamine N-acyltransferase
MEFSAQQIADFLGGKVVGDPSVKVNTFARIEEGKLGALSFLSNPKYFHHIYDCQSSIVLVNHDFETEKAVSNTLIKVDNAYESLAALMTLVEQQSSKKKGISPLAFVSKSAKIGTDVYVAPFAYIGDNVWIDNEVSIHANVSISDGVKIGYGSTLFSNVSVYKNCEIGKNCTVHSGAVIGSDGFGFAPTETGEYKKIPQIGNVVLEDDVEIGANTTIDRATMGSTIIRKGVKLDNLIQIAHNVEIGDNTVMAAQVGVSGSTKIGKQCVIAGQAAFVGHLNIADKTTLGGQAAITSSVKESGKILQGSPAIPIANFQRSSILFKNLPELNKTVQSLEKQLKELQNKLSEISQQNV